MKDIWLVLAIVGMGADWVVVWQGGGKIKYVTKPLALITLMIWFGTGYRSDGLMTWFGLGLAFSLIGDILLLFSYRYFIHGLGAFLLTHVFYAAELTCCLPAVTRPFWILLGAVICLWGMILVALEQGISACPILNFEDDKLRRVLNIPDKYDIAIVLVLGFPDESPVLEVATESIVRWVDNEGVYHIPKRELKNIIHRNGFL